MRTTARRNHRHGPSAVEYRKLSELVPLPELLPGLGTVYVDPKKLPSGPFLAYDDQNRLTSSTYVVPTMELIDRAELEALSIGLGPVDDIDLWFDEGDEGLSEAHCFVVLWHVPKSERDPLGPAGSGPRRRHGSATCSERRTTCGPSS